MLVCVNIERDPAIRVPQELLVGFDILSVRLQQSSEGMPECMPADVLVDAICPGNWPDMALHSCATLTLSLVQITGQAKT